MRPISFFSLLRRLLCTHLPPQNAEGVVAFYDANSIKEGNKFLIAGEGFGITDDEEVCKNLPGLKLYDEI